MLFGRMASFIGGKEKGGGWPTKSVEELSSGERLEGAKILSLYDGRASDSGVVGPLYSGLYLKREVVDGYELLCLIASNHVRRIRKEMPGYLAVSLICAIFARSPRFIVSSCSSL
jgi:hypothetical protein